MAKIALITGVTGQDGAYLARLLLEKGEQVVGVTRGTKELPIHLRRLIEQYPEKILIETCNLSDRNAVDVLIQKHRPDEIYHLSAQTVISLSFDQPLETLIANGMTTVNLLEAIRRVRPDCRFLLASSSEVFGETRATHLTIETLLNATNPYAESKIFAQQKVAEYRQEFGLHASSAILFNHESPLRPANFVTQKIVAAAVAISRGQQQFVPLGNLSAVKDWSYAGDVVEALFLMLQQEQPGDFLIASGKSHTVRDFCSAAFSEVGIDLQWSGSGLDEFGSSADGVVRVVVDPQFFRNGGESLPEIDLSRTFELLNWRPRVTFSQLIKMMVESAQAPRA